VVLPAHVLLPAHLVPDIEGYCDRAAHELFRDCGRPDDELAGAHLRVGDGLNYVLLAVRQKQDLGGGV